MPDHEFLSGLTDRGAIVRFAKSGKLHTLDARPLAASLSASELSHIFGLVELRRLELDGAQLSDEVATGIANLQRVRHLDLQRTLITDATLDVFRELPQLQFLLLTGSLVSKAGVETLRKGLINARIVFL